MRMKRWGKDRSLLARYLVTNLSIAIFACAIVGMILFSFSIAQLDRTYRKEQLSRLKLAADDLQRQEKIWENNALDIQFDEIYRPNWFQRDATYEVELVKALEKYEGTSPIIQNFFLLYRENGHVYYPDRKNYYPIHIQSLGIIEGADTLYTQFISVIHSDLVVHENGRAFLCYNLPMNKQAPLGDAVLICCIDRILLKERLETVMGQGMEEIYVYYNNRCISADQAPALDNMVWEQRLYQDQNMLAAQSDNGIFVVLSPVVTSASHLLLDNLRTVCLWIFGGFTMLMILLSCWAAYRNYSPINKLMRRYAPNSKRGNNELEQINRLLSSSMEFKEKAQVALMNQMDELEAQRLQIRRQLLLLLLSGNWDIPEAEMRENGCLPLPKPCFGLLALRLLEGADANSICELIEELSGDDMLFYTTPLQDTSFVVILVNLEERALLSLAIDLIEGVQEAPGEDFLLLPGEICDHVGDLSRALVTIFTTSPESQGAHPSEINCEIMLQEIIASLTGGDEDIAMKQLEKLLLELPKAYPSLMIRRYLYAGIFNTLLETARQIGTDLSDHHGIPSLLTAQESTLRAAVLSLAKDICLLQEKKAGDAGDTKDIVDQAVLDYIEVNLLDWALNLDSVAEAVGVSSRQISRILRRCQNTTYKEFVTSRRMEKAKEFLTAENLSVAETSQRVCYASVSYFIKAFRQATGMTPANYKLLMKCAFSETENHEM